MTIDAVWFGEEFCRRRRRRVLLGRREEEEDAENRRGCRDDDEYEFFFFLFCFEYRDDVDDEKTDEKIGLKSTDDSGCLIPSKTRRGTPPWPR